MNGCVGFMLYIMMCGRYIEFGLRKGIKWVFDKKRIINMIKNLGCIWNVFNVMMKVNLGSVYVESILL